MSELWIIIGASSAIAKALAAEAAADSADILLAGRDSEDLDCTAADLAIRFRINAQSVHCDVADPASRKALLERCRNVSRRLNVLMAAGLMPEQADLQNDPSLLQTSIEANYSGPVILLESFAAEIERRKGGRIVIIGSVAGDRGRKKNYLYGSAKAGLAVYAEGLRARLFPCGASVTVAKPGFVDTAMTWGLPGMFLVSSPKAAGAAVYKAAMKGRADLYHPFFWRWIMLVIKFIPSGVMKRLNF